MRYFQNHNQSQGQEQPQNQTPRVSLISHHVEAFTGYRKASDNWCDFYDYMIWRFERYCAENYPQSEYPTQEMVDSWCRQHSNEKNNSCRARIYAVVNMVRYLRQRGLTDVNDPPIPRKERVTFIPHAFTVDELKRFFAACDNLPKLPYRKEIRSRRITLPVFFRLLFSSGMRTFEARMLRCIDVDLQNGVLSIKQSKGRRNQHFVVLHDSMLELMRRYDTAIGEIYPGREYFFPATNGGPHTKKWLQVNFNRLWDEVHKANNAEKSRATSYAFRHNYAITNINYWLDEGFGFEDKLMYLSKSMGHYDIESTKYYYSLTATLADVLAEKTGADFDDIVPDVDYDTDCEVDYEAFE